LEQMVGDLVVSKSAAKGGTSLKELPTPPENQSGSPNRKKLEVSRVVNRGGKRGKLDKVKILGSFNLCGR